jgi:2-polyprenyl-3-methyl-5-hydroxy-6-metoxy-1,4-benzoquinol methylase
MTEQNSSEHQAYVEQNREIWDKEAASFDMEIDHGLIGEDARAAWKAVLQNALNGQGLEVLDIGCGTGSLSILLAELGHRVTGVDLSPAMIDLAKAKTQKEGQAIQFQVMDAAFPDFPAQRFDAILCRHLLWTLPEPAKVLQRWIKLLRPKGRLVLIEGFWHTGAGLKSKALLEMLPDSMKHVRLQALSEQQALWGKVVDDERYLITAKGLQEEVE